MRVSEYRDLLTDLSNTLASAKSAATFVELHKETERLQAKLAECRHAATQCPTVKRKDTLKADRLFEQARQFVCDCLMAIHDNQRLEAEYLGEEYSFVNPSQL